MFERYTEKARRVIFFGRYEASQFGSSLIETEHLLLGILREEKALALQLLKSSGGMESIRKEIEGHTEIREKKPTQIDIPLSNESKRVLAYAAEEAEKLGHKHIGVGHLLMGLLREEKCFAAQLLHERGINLDSARDVVKTFEGGGQLPAQGAQAASRAGAFDIAELGVDLTQQAMDGKLPDLIQRESELVRVMQVLCRLTRGNPVLVGEAGVGKKSIVHGLAHRIAEGKVATGLQSSRLISLDLAVIASGTTSRTRFEGNLETIVQQLWGAHNIVFFVEGLHTLAQTQRFLSVVNVLKPALILGSVHCISTATPEEYRKTVEAARWLEELFTMIEVRPPREPEALEVLRGVKGRFEKYHNVTYTEEALRYAVFHANSYFPGCYLPEKAIDLIDEAGAWTKLQQPEPPAEVREAQKKIKFIQDRHDRSLDNREFEKARFYSDELRKEQENLKVLVDKYKPGTIITPAVGRDEIEKIVAEKAGVPIDLLRRSRASGETTQS